MAKHEINLVGVRESLASFGTDLSRSYLFSISIPSIVSDSGSKSIMTILCASTKTPEFNLVPAKTQVTVSTIKISLVSGIDFQPWSMNLIGDGQDVVRSNLLTWSSVAYDFNRKGASTPSSYKKTIDVMQLNTQGQSVCNYKLYGAYPQQITGTDLSNENAEISKYQVIFQYDYFTYENFIRASKPDTSPPIKQQLNDPDLQGDSNDLRIA